MRILQVVHTFMPECVGGTEVHTYQLARDLRARHHEVAVFYRSVAQDQPDLSLREDSYEGIPVFRFVNRNPWKHGPLFWHFIPEAEPHFLEALDRFQPDLVHFQHLSAGLSSSFVRLAAARGLPTLLTMHDYYCLCPISQLRTVSGELCQGPEGGMRCYQCHPPAFEAQAPPVSASLGRLRQELASFGLRATVLRAAGYAIMRLVWPWLQQRIAAVDTQTPLRLGYTARDRYFRQLLDIPDALLSPSQFLRRTFENWGIPGGRILHIRNGVEPEGLRRPRVTGSGKLRLVYLGAIQVDKGLDVLVEAMQSLKKAPVELRIYGNDRLWPETIQYADGLRRRAAGAQVSFMGPLPHSQVGEVLAASDALVLPAVRYENCPISILEALYAGVPVIAANLGGMAELVRDGHDGILFRPGDAGDLANKVRQLASDPTLLEKLRQGIGEVPTTAQVSEKIERVYERLLELRRQGLHGAEAQRALAAWHAGQEAAQ